MKWNGLVNIVESFFKKNISPISRISGVLGMGTATILGVRATSKAEWVLADAREKKGGEKLTKLEVVKAVWTFYIPTVLLSTVSAGAIIGRGYLDDKQHAALATVYGISESAFKMYREKVVETLGNRKEEKIRDEIAKDALHKIPENQGIFIVGDGTTLCYDEISKQLFSTDIESVRKAQNDFNHKLMLEMYLPINEFYDLLGIERMKTGDDMGWNTSTGFMDIHFTAELIKGRPYLAITHMLPPDTKYKEH